MKSSTLFLLVVLPFMGVLIVEFVLFHSSDQARSLLKDPSNSKVGTTAGAPVRSSNDLYLPKKKAPSTFMESKAKFQLRFQEKLAVLSGVKQKTKSHQFVDLPQTKQSKDRIIYYLHIHKSAGSAMCIAARENGLKVADTNCNVQQDQRCCGWGDGLRAQEEYAAMTPYGFVANERDLYDTMDLKHYRYVVTLRKSKERYLSHWKHVIRWHYPSYMTNFSSWWRDQPDNWNFRKICGTACQSIPKYQITEELFVSTVKRLERFEDVLLFERFNQSFAQFAQHVGWTRMPVSIGRKKNVTYPSSDGDWEPMMSALDDALYELAEARHKNVPHAHYSKETLDNLHAYFESDKGSNCTSTCCAETCSLY